MLSSLTHLICLSCFPSLFVYQKVGAVLQMLQGFSSSLFYWDGDEKSFRCKSGMYVEHLSHTSLHAIVNQFMYAATCLQLVEILISKFEKSVRLPPPTLRAFTCSVSAWLKVCSRY